MGAVLLFSGCGNRGLKEDAAKIGDLDVTSVADVFAGIRAVKIGQTVPVDVVRNNQTVTLQVTMGSDATAQ